MFNSRAPNRQIKGYCIILNPEQYYQSLSSCSRINFNKSRILISPPHFRNVIPNQTPALTKKYKGITINQPMLGRSMARNSWMKKNPSAMYNNPMPRFNQRVNGIHCRSRFSQRFSQRNSWSESFITYLVVQHPNPEPALPQNQAASLTLSSAASISATTSDKSQTWFEIPASIAGRLCNFV
jgi:hypothetical protein